MTPPVPAYAAMTGETLVMMLRSDGRQLQFDFVLYAIWRSIYNIIKTPVPCATGVKFCPGDDLLSHAVTHAVPSALEGLTSVFGMGTGVTPPL